MPLSDLLTYRRYTERRRLPSRRIEKLLAQISLVLCQVHGAKDARLSMFMFDPPPDEAPDEAPDPEAVATAVGFAPRKRPPRQDTGDTAHGQ